MTTGTELIPCPGCGSQVHPRASDCPSCGYRPEGARFEDMLGTLSLISSILVGFGLESMIALVTADEIENPIADWTFGVWTVGSILLLVVMVAAEAIRRREIVVRNLRPDEDNVQRARRRCDRLLRIFSLAMIPTTAGVVLLGFLFSTTHGWVGVSAVAVGLLLIVWTLR